MTVAVLSPDPRLRELTDLGVVAPGALLTTYAAESTTPLATYSNFDLTTPNTNPLEASSGGLFGPIYLTPGVQYKFVLTTSLGVPLWEQDHVGTGGVSAPNTFNVIAYGATGGGVVDDAASIQAAIDACIDAGGGTVYFPPGIFRCIAALNAKNSGKVQFVGDSPATSIIRWTDAATKGLSIDTLVSTSTSSLLTVNPDIGDYTVVVANGALFTIGDWCYLQDDLGTHGGFTTHITDIVGNTITLAEAVPVTVTMADGAALFHFTNDLLQGIVVRDLGFSCVAGSGTVNKLTLLEIVRCADFTIQHCTFDGAAAPLVTPKFNKRGLITNCYFTNAETVSGAGVEVQTSTGLTIQNCSSYRCRFGFTVARSPRSKIEGCNATAFGDLTGRMLKVSGGSNFTAIVGNTSSDSGFTGVRIENSAYVTVAGNSFFAGSSLQNGAGLIESAGSALLSHHQTIVGNNLNGGQVPAGFSGAGGIVCTHDTAGIDTYNTIQGNVISQCGSYGIYLNCSHNTVCGNTVGSSLSSGAIIFVPPSNGYNIISDNILITEGGATLSAAIYTLGSAGFNLIGINKFDSGAAALNLATTDIIVASTIWKIPTASQTAVHTGANTNETTAWTVTIPAAAFSASLQQGFRASAFLTTANNANDKTIRVKCGATLTFTFSLVGAAAQNLNIIVTVEAFFSAGAMAITCQLLSTTAAAAAGYTFNQSGTCSDSFTNPVDFVITMQNGSATANDINFGSGKFVYEGVIIRPTPVN